MNILCYGDSNTYGYNPENAGRYEERYRWVDLLASAGHSVKNEGLNGREIPTGPSEYAHLNMLLEKHGETDLLILALGVNDAYNMPEPSAPAIADRWRGVFANTPALETLQRRGVPVILVVPPIGPTYFWGGQKAEDIATALQELPAQYGLLALEQGLILADASQWDIGLADDGVHFTRRGSRKFFEQINALIMSHGDSSL